MTVSHSALVGALCLVSVGLVSTAQEPRAAHPAANNPHLGNKESIRAGMAAYRVTCGDCHGLDAGGYRGPDLIAFMAGGATDERLFDTIRKGVPGTEMPAQDQDMSDNDILQIIAYLRNLGSVAAPESPIGNAENGRRLFARQCTTCHRIAGEGGRLGPELSRIGATRSRAALTREIRTPSAWIAPGFETVTIVTKDGQRIRGVKKAEDVFSIQIMDTRERLQGYLKANLQDVIHEPSSLMPTYGAAQLSDGDLSDLLGYLSTLRGASAALAATPATPGTAATPSSPIITPSDLVDGLKDSSRWLTYSGDYSGQRHSPLTQITPENVDRLTAQWTFQTGTLGSFQTTPIVVDGVLYVTGFNNTAWAIDARTGRQIWRYRRELPEGLKLCCGAINRGFGVLGDRLFMGTLDAHLVALDMKTGGVLFDVELVDHKAGYSVTVAPLVVKDKVIVGVAGAEYGIRGFIDAYDARTGARAWRFYTVAGPGDPGARTWPQGDAYLRGGGSIWVTGTYDPQQNLLFFGTGNPGPDYYSNAREGDNLYTTSLVALDLDTGERRWHYQFTPHDVHDWDSTQVPVLGDLTINGQARKVVMFANRNGFFYTIDRVTGKVIVAKPFVETTWAKEIDSNGRPVLLPGHLPDEDGTKTCPDLGGGTNFMSPSFDPTTRLFFVTARETCATYFGYDQRFKVGDQYTGGGTQRPRDQKNFGALRAIDPVTATVKWEFRYTSTSASGVLTTASGLVFAADGDGNLMAFESRTGKNLWHYQLGFPMRSTSGTTYMVDGRQYLLVPAGSALTAFALPQR
ncbi:MAG TPA: PQQ-dependent dehydrogenase, methanol/ethanol family [Vicinamibacterales bacterium]|jgi:alcohol dehydrogenase (cytochrome c)|nr:PQQ-dependent dehydrogenase, methanol/ethanol family [Vicinamibacterales bacterium]